MQITKQSITSLEFSLSDDDGRLIDNSEKSGPLVYMHGTGGLFPALESKLEGKSAGDTLVARIAPEEAYGQRDEKRVQSVPRSHLPADMEIEVGMQFQSQSIEGMVVMTVANIDGDTIQLDGNHPFAGVALNFDLKIVEVREATAEELQHGHAHGEGGHHH